jgi:peptide chain release factor subunit 3
LVITINKMDEATVKWSKDRYEEIKTNLSPFLVTCGFDLEKDVYWVPISGFTADNIKDRVDKKICNWYNGPSLLELIDDMEIPERDASGPIRIPIIDKLKDRGVVVFGKVESGTINMGDKLML